MNSFDRIFAARRLPLWMFNKYIRPLAPMQMPADIAERLCIDQASDLAYIMRAISLAGLSTNALLIADFRHTNIGFESLIAFAGVIACYAAIIWYCQRWLSSANRIVHEAQKSIERLRLIIAILGLFWAMLLVVLMWHANDDQRDLLYGVAVGCMATPVMVAPISCAIVFWVPVVLGALASLFVWRTTDPFTVVCLFGFTTLTGSCMVYLNRRLNERAISTVRVEEHSEVIKLLLRDFEENTSDWLWETNADMELLEVSMRLAEVARRNRDEITGIFPEALLGEVAHFDQRVSSPVLKLKRLIADRSAFRDLVVPVIIDGEERCWSLTGKPILDKSGNFTGYHGVGSDITAQRRSQEQIAFLARHDSLTKLPNRVLFNEVLHQACTAAHLQGLALLCLDLDDFKLVNDTLGHATGDGVLVSVAERIRSCIRETDTAARLGGDEFAIILMSADLEEVSMIAERIVERVSRPYYFDGQLVEIGCSLGISMAPRDHKTPNGLLKNADLALYRAKSEGRGVWRQYDPAMDERLQDRRSLQSDLRQALLRGDFYLEFQPIIDLNTHRIIAAEALLRWNHPERGILAPAEFVPLAEEAGFIGPIGNWVLRQACRAASLWPPHVRVAVNLSPLQFRDASLIDTIDRALADSGLAPGRLELEITETTMLETNSQTVDALWSLHGRGLRVALDDFGTGYSSLSYLRRFPFDKIKIDRSFIRDLGFEKDDSSIIIAIIGLARNLNMTVTAEGVETSGQAALLKSYGCEQAQGYLFFRPLAADEIGKIISLDHKFDWAGKLDKALQNTKQDAAE